MSGLAVIFQRDGTAVDAAAVRQMLDAVPHRALDGAWVRVWPAAGLGLGYAKLTITPEEVDEQQPLLSLRTGCVLVADTRLDNRRELLARLPGAVAPRATDAELILRAYETWGLEAPKYLMGDFAFALWDPRHQTLLLARDATGQRSLFYRDDGRTFAAASELHQLLQDPSVRVQPNENRVRDFLVPLNVHRNSKEQHETFYEGVYTVLAGHTTIVSRAGTATSRFWDIDEHAELRYRHDDDYAEHFRTLFYDAVESRLRSTRPVAATLSGGLDSASIVCAAQELYRAGRSLDHGFTSFSTVFDGLECDERPRIEDTQSKYGFDARYTPPPPFNGLVRLEPRYFAEEPTMSSEDSGGPMMQAVAERGSRILLTGDVADAYVGGSRYVFDSLLRQGHLRAFWHYFRTFRRLADESIQKTVGLSCVAPLLPLAIQRQLTAGYTRRVLLSNWDRLVPDWMLPDLQDDLRRRHLALGVGMEQSRRFSSPAREEQYQMLYPPLLARNYAGWPMELCRPYADRRLHEFMLAIPPEQLFKPHPQTDEYYAGSKQLVRRALRGVLPESVRTLTTKTVFGSVYTSDAARHWPAYEKAFGPSARPLVVEHGYVDQARFWHRLELLRGGTWTADAIYLIRVMGLETWLRGFNQPREQLISVPAPWRSLQSEAGTAPFLEAPVGAA
jgi:asparagine synthase (glutamine-hydrolysing)